MAALLALCSAACYGSGDFFGGLASRTRPARAVVVVSQVVGLLWLTTLAPFLGGNPTVADLLAGCAGGAIGGVALLIFYQALATGTMSVVAPITAVISAAVPVAVGVLGGERPGIQAGVGIMLALPAVWLLGGGGGAAASRQIDRSGLAAAVLAGVGFGLFFVAFSWVGKGAGAWPAAASRAASVLLQSLLLRKSRGSVKVASGLHPLVIVGGLADSSANLLYLFAVQRGGLAEVSVLSSMYPAATVLLAALWLKERLSTSQFGGVAIAVTAVVLIASG